MLTIQNMKADDWEEVSQLDTLAFNSYYQKTGRETLIHHRTQANLNASLAMHPNGCFIVKNDKLVGYIFSRVWGKLGWIGTFGIDPDYQGQGVGQKLITRAIESLEKAGCTTIGLETMPDSPYNVGLYTRLGFNPSYPTLYLTKTSSAIYSMVPFDSLNQLEDKDALSYIASLSQATDRELDYVREAQNAMEYGWGDTLLMGWPQPWGFIIVRTISTRDSASQSICEVISIVITPEARNRLGEVLQLLESYANGLKASQITLPVNAIDSEALQEVIGKGYHVNRVNLRMIYRKGYRRPTGIDLSRWIM